MYRLIHSIYYNMFLRVIALLLVKKTGQMVQRTRHVIRPTSSEVELVLDDHLCVLV